jgi:hypothetical protein
VEECEAAWNNLFYQATTSQMSTSAKVPLHASLKQFNKDGLPEVDL